MHRITGEDTKLTWEEMNPSSYMFNEEVLIKLQETIKKWKERNIQQSTITTGKENKMEGYYAYYDPIENKYYVGGTIVYFTPRRSPIEEDTIELVIRLDDIDKLIHKEK